MVEINWFDKVFSSGLGVTNKILLRYVKKQINQIVTSC